MAPRKKGKPQPLINPPIKPSGTTFDSRIKEILTKGLPVLMLAMGINFENYEATSLATQLPKSFDKDVDCLVQLKDKISGEITLIHIEFQSKFDPEFDKRMFLFCAMIYLQFKIMPKQYVIHLGKITQYYDAEIIEGEVSYKYNALYTQSMDFELFLNSPTPEGLMFAAIAQHIDKKKDADKFFEKILSFNLSENILFDLLGIAETLGKLSEFADYLKNKRKEMALDLDFTQTPLYQEIHEKGMEDGLEKGIEKGIEKGKIKSLLELYRSGLIAMEIVLDRIGISENKLPELLNNPEYQ